MQKLKIREKIGIYLNSFLNASEIEIQIRIFIPSPIYILN